MTKFKYQVYMTNPESNERFLLCKSRSRENAIKNARAWYNDQINPRWKPSDDRIRWATEVYNSIEIVEA